MLSSPSEEESTDLFIPDPSMSENPSMLDSKPDKCCDAATVEDHASDTPAIFPEKANVICDMASHQDGLLNMNTIQ